MSFNVFIPGTPGAKGRPRFNRKTGRTWTPAKTVKYETYLKQAMALQMQDLGLDPIDAPVKVVVVFYMPEPKTMAKKRKGRGLPHSKRPDLDNLLKAVLDAMNEVVVKDDSRIWWLVAEKHYAGGPGVEISVTVEGEMVP